MWRSIISPRNAEPSTVRLDRWLWAARFFKTRALSAAAVAGGKVHVNGARAKSSKQLRVGDQLRVRIGPYDWLVVVRAIAMIGLTLVVAYTSIHDLFVHPAS